MATSYPGALDSFVNPTSTDLISSATVPHATQHTNVNGAVIQLETKLGTGSTTPAAGYELAGTGAGASAWRQTPAAHAYNSANISISNSVTTALALDSEVFDTDSMHSTVSNTGRVTINTAGKYLLVAQVEWANNTTGQRDTIIRKNGSAEVGKMEFPNTTSGGGAIQIATALLDCAAADYFEITVFQNSGGALNVLNSATSRSPSLAAVRVG